MLSVLEERILAALTVALPDTVSIVAGPTHQPRSQQTQLVVVAAQGLEVLRKSDGDLETGRRPAHLFHVQRWSADGSTLDFEIPAEVAGEVVEVESPPGHAIKRGDAYYVEGRVIKFYRPPPASADAVIATIRGDLALGFQDKRDCRVSLQISAWAKDAQNADQLLSTSLAAALRASVTLGNLESVSLSDTTTRIRLLNPLAALTGIERTAQKVGQAEFIRALAQITVQGELEVTVALGEPEVEGIIERIEYAYQSLSQPVP